MDIKLINKSNFGIETYCLSNDNGLKAEIINYGGRINKLFVKSKNGELIDIVCGFENVDEFLGTNPYFNAIIGRVANRIGKAKFFLDNKEYNLYKNNGNNHLHGGKNGFDRKLWKATIINDDIPKLKLSYVSKDMEENYPNNLYVDVFYSLDNENKLNIEYFAKSDGKTLCNLTNHAYFNLSGDFAKPVYDQKVFINSNKITEIDNELIPTGNILDITNSPCDFSKEKSIGKDINENDKSLKIANGYDFNYIFNSVNDNECKAYALSEKTGIKMEVYTDMPCMQFYSGNFLNGIKGKQIYNKHTAFCMETQKYPNACNIDSFPSIVLEKDTIYKSKTSYKFSIV